MPPYTPEYPTNYLLRLSPRTLSQPPIIFLIKPVLQSSFDNIFIYFEPHNPQVNCSTPMSQNSSKILGVKSSWSLLEFARLFGKMKVTNPLVNKNTNEVFRSCAFVNPFGAVTLVGFSSKLGELTPRQIAARKDSLQVVQLESGGYKLCESVDTWEDVDLGL